MDILGGRVTLFRDQETGVARCLDDWCPHRGAPLSGGQVKQDSEGEAPRRAASHAMHASACMLWEHGRRALPPALFRSHSADDLAR